MGKRRGRARTLLRRAGKHVDAVGKIGADDVRQALRAQCHGAGGCGDDAAKHDDR